MIFHLLLFGCISSELPVNTEDYLAKYKFKTIITGGANKLDSLPLIILVHGLGSNPDSVSSICQNYQKPVRCIMPMAPTPTPNGGGSWFPFKRNDPDIVRTGKAVSESASDLAEFVKAAEEHYPTSKKPLIAGFSQGGMLSFAIAAQNPDLVGAVFPIGGYLYPGMLTQQSGPLPEIWAFHGDDDQVVPLEPTLQNIEDLKKAGYQAEIKTYPNLGHSINQDLINDLYLAFNQELGF